MLWKLKFQCSTGTLFNPSLIFCFVCWFVQLAVYYLFTYLLACFKAWYLVVSALSEIAM